MSLESGMNSPERTGEVAQATEELASRSKRLMAALVDACISIIVTFPVMMTMGVIRQLREEQTMTMQQTVFFFFFGMVVFLLIHGYFLAKYGQTVGKRLIGTRIVSYADGQLLPLGKLFGLRYLPIAIIAQIPFVGSLFAVVDILFVFGPERRCLHDLIAGTKVIRA